MDLEPIRAALLLQRGYLAHIALRLRVVPSTAIPVMAVDRHFRLYIHWEGVARYPFPAQVAILAHEVAHLALNHFERLVGVSSPQLAALAKELEVNSALAADGLPLPEDALTPHQFGLPLHLTAEEYYDLLSEKAGQATPSPTSAHGGEPGSQPTPIHAAAARAAATHAAAEGEPRRPWELGPDPTGPEDAPVGSLEAAILRAATEEAAKQAGHVPHWLRRSARAAQAPVSWQAILRRALTRALTHAAGVEEISYRRPQRHPTPGRILLPSLVEARPEVCIVIDTSGSMDERKLGQALSITAQAARALSELTVCSGDTRIAWRARVRHSREVKLIGGGGTEMDTILSQIASTSPRPSVIVVITDGFTHWPEKPFGIPTLAILLDPETKAWVPPWIQAIPMPGG